MGIPVASSKLITSWEISLSRYILMDLNEFPWAAIIIFFPLASWSSIKKSLDFWSKFSRCLLFFSVASVFSDF
uniref:Putative ovule protein n=1 Tax=Solanum chacoense TaxID=4108 RepID=A0A0V0I2G7_SOLCH